MENDNRDVPDVGNQHAKPEKKEHPKSGLKHVLETGLPPGLEPDGTEDPGSNAEDIGPVDNRS